MSIADLERGLMNVSSQKAAERIAVLTSLPAARIAPEVRDLLIQNKIPLAKERSVSEVLSLSR